MITLGFKEKFITYYSKYALPQPDSAFINKYLMYDSVYYVCISKFKYVDIKKSSTKL